jgi:ABC-type lipoprotein release transport system permease subunit
MMALMGDRLYPRLTINLLLGRAVVVAIIAAIASLYPAWRASRREPAEVLHYV